MGEWFEEFARERAHRLHSLDPQVPLDDLEPLLDIVGQARVVAIGENNHHVREFGLLRHRILRLLVERAGFTAVGVESGFTEGRSVRVWVRGGPGEVGEVAAEGTGFSLGEAEEFQGMLRWLRQRYATGHEVDFHGLDVPGSAGTPERALRAVADYLGAVDPGALVLVRAAEQTTGRYAGASSAVAMGRFGGLEPPARDAATAAVSRLLAHVEALRPVYVQRGGRNDYEVALRHVRGVWRLDQYLRELEAMSTGATLTGLTSSRDAHMAETVRWLLAEQGPAGRVAVLVHNGHLQRVPFAVGATTPIVPMGQQLAADLGADYAAVAITCGGGSTPSVVLDPGERLGFRVGETELPPAQPGSVEALLAGSGPSLLDLRAASAPDGEAPQRIRHADGHVEVPVFEAFDALVHLPVVRSTGFVTDGEQEARGG